MSQPTSRLVHLFLHSSPVCQDSHLVTPRGNKWICTTLTPHNHGSFGPHGVSPQSSTSSGSAVSAGLIHELKVVTPRGSEWIHPTLTPYNTCLPFFCAHHSRLPLHFNGANNPQNCLPLLLRGPEPPFNTWLLGPTWLSAPNCIPIGSAICAGLTNETNRQTDRNRDRQTHSHTYRMTKTLRV